MAVSSHLKIHLSEYDERIRTFIPDYDEMVEAAAAALEISGRPVRQVIDLGIGSGALAERCKAWVPGAEILGIDADDDMLVLARRRLGNSRVKLLHGDFSRTKFPRCDAITASFALHHIPTSRQKALLYARCFAALRLGGLLVNADCCLASNPRLAALHRAAWHAHLARSYGANEAEGFLNAWSHEDFYFRLEDEIAMMRRAGFGTDVAWRRGSFAVIIGAKPGRGTAC